MMRRLTESFRIVPPRLDAVCLLAIAIMSLAFMAWELFQAGSDFIGLFTVFAAILVLLAVYCIGQLLPGCPIDHIEVGPGGLTVGGLFGRRQRRWEYIDRFSVFVLPLGRSHIVRIKAVSRDPKVPDMTFSMAQSMKAGWFVDGSEQAEDLRGWFENMKAVYSKGSHSGALPEAPQRFTGRIISWPM